MGQVQFIEYKGKKIVEMDFQNFIFKDISTIKEIMDEAKRLIVSQPEGSVLTLTNVTGLRFSPEMISLFDDFTEHNKTYVKNGAVVGIIGLQKLAYNAVMRFSGRNLPIFKAREEALEWLIQQN